MYCMTGVYTRGKKCFQYTKQDSPQAHCEYCNHITFVIRLASAYR